MEHGRFVLGIQLYGQVGRQPDPDCKTVDGAFGIEAAAADVYQSINHRKPKSRVRAARLSPQPVKRPHGFGPFRCGETGSAVVYLDRDFPGAR